MTDNAGNSMLGLRIVLEKQLKKHDRDSVSFVYDEDHECFTVKGTGDTKWCRIVRTKEDIPGVIAAIREHHGTAGV